MNIHFIKKPHKFCSTIIKSNQNNKFGDRLEAFFFERKTDWKLITSLVQHIWVVHVKNGIVLIKLDF